MHYIVLHCIRLYHAVPYCTTPDYTVLHCTATYHIAPHCTVYRTVRHCTTLYHTVFLYYTVLRCSTRYCTVLHGARMWYRREYAVNGRACFVCMNTRIRATVLPEIPKRAACDHIARSSPQFIDLHPMSCELPQFGRNNEVAHGQHSTHQAPLFAYMSDRCMHANQGSGVLLIGTGPLPLHSVPLGTSLEDRMQTLTRGLDFRRSPSYNFVEPRTCVFVMSLLPSGVCLRREPWVCGAYFLTQSLLFRSSPMFILITS